METHNTIPQDVLSHYIHNVRQVARKLQAVQQKQRQSIEELLQLKSRCQQIRENLGA